MPIPPPPPPKKISYAPILVVLIIVMSFFLGLLVNKVQFLENQSKGLGGGSLPQAQGAQAQQPAAAPAISSNDIKKWAKDLGLDTNKFNRCFDASKYKDVVEKDQTEGQTAGVSGTPSFFVNGTLIVGAQPYTQFKDALDKAISGTTGTVQVKDGHLPILGSKDAKVTLIEFSDFECPFCRNFYKDTELSIRKEYVDTGKVKMLYRHYPLPFHPSAMPFAIASECANEQGKFWEMHDKIFTSQP